MPPLDRKTKDEGIRLAEAKGAEYFSGTIGKVELHRFLDDYKVDRVELRDIQPDAMTIERPDQGFTLFLKSSQPKVRHRFSVAHELAHLLLTPVLGKRVVHRRRFAKHQDPFGDQVEYLCNDMAAAILMPASHVSPLMSDNGYTARCVPEIARAFDTSFEAASRRFIALNERCCGLIVWAQGQQEDLLPTKHHLEPTTRILPLGVGSTMLELCLRQDRDEFQYVPLLRGISHRDKRAQQTYYEAGSGKCPRGVLP